MDSGPYSIVIGTVFVCFTPFRKNPSCVPMNAIMNKTNNGKRLVAAVAVLALIICAILAFIPSESNGAAISNQNVTIATDGEEYNADGTNYYLAAGSITINAVASQTASIYLADGASVTIVGAASAGAITVYKIDSSYFTPTSVSTGEPTTGVVDSGTDTNITSVAITALASQNATVTANAGEGEVIDISTNAISTVTTITAATTGGAVNITTSETVSGSFALGLASATLVTYTNPIEAEAANTPTAITLVSNVTANIIITEPESLTQDVSATVKTGNFVLTGAVSYGSYSISGTDMDVDLTACYTNTGAVRELSLDAVTGGKGFTNSGVDTSAITTLTPTTALDISGLGLDSSTITAVTGTADAPVTGTFTGADYQVGVTDFNGTLTLSSKTVTAFTSGTLNLISGEFTYTPTTVLQGATLNILTDAYLTVTALTVGEKDQPATDGVATVNQYRVLEAASDITVKITDNGRYNALSGAALEKVILVAEESGVLNTTGAMEDVIIDSGSLISTGEYSQFQNVIINTTLTISRPANVTILGKLTINPGVTLYIADNATLNIGKASSNVAADLDVQGTLDVTGTLSIYSDDMKISNGGTINIESDGTLQMGGGKLTVGANSQLNINGSMNFTSASVTIANQGTVTITEAKIASASNNVVIDMISNGAVANIQSVTSDTAGKTITIQDSGIEDKNVVTKSNNSIVLKINAANDVVSGLTVTETVTYETIDGDRVYTNNMVLSGSILVENSVNPIADGTPAKDISEIAGSSILVTDSFSIGEFVQMNVRSGNLIVSGTMNVVDGSKMIGAGEVTVTGQIIAAAQVYNGSDTLGIPNLNAAEYKVIDGGNTTWYYTNLDAAVNAGQNAVTVYGDITVSEDMTIPSPVTVTINGTGTITVEDDVTMTIASGAKIRNGNVYVDGTVEAEKYRDSTSTFHSDVMTVNGDAATYTNIYNALETAEPNSTVVITRSPDAVVIDRDLEIPADVTLQVDAARALNVNDDVTVTVNGTLFVNGGNVNAATMFGPEAGDAVSGLVVNGLYKSLNSVDYDEETFDVAGAYYYMTDAAGSYYYIAPLDTAVTHIADAVDIDVYGDNEVSDLTVTGTEDGAETITVYGQLTAGTITMSQADFVIDAAGEFTGTVASEAGSVDMVNVAGVTVSADVYDEAVRTLISGTPAQADNETNAPEAELTAASGTVTVAQNLDFTEATNAVKFAVAESAAVTVTGSGVTLNLGEEAVIDGTLTAIDNGAVNATTMVVFGTFTVAEATADNDAGSARISNLYAGITNDITSKKTTVSQTAAAVNGSISGLKQIYVGAEATVPSELVQGFKSTAFYVEDALFVTVYANSGVYINDIYTPNVNAARVLSWEYENDEGNMTDVENDRLIGYYSEVYGKMKYDVYKVQILVDSGFSDVYIDGQVVATDGIYIGSTNLYLTAGQHTVSYKLNNGWSGEIEISFNGTVTTDGSFTISETTPFVDANGTEITYKLVITGAEASGYNPGSGSSDSGDSGLGLTDYLLIVLVVLIVVMAIIVAIRLMRS